MAKDDLRIPAALLGLLLVGGCGTPNPESPAPIAVELAEPNVPAGPLLTALPSGVSGTLLFHADREGRHKLFTLNLTTGVVTRLTAGRDRHDEQAAWSPDGTQIAFTTTRFDARTWSIAVKGVTESDVRPVTMHMAFDRHASWMPDGRSLLFSSERDGTQAVFRTWLDSGVTARVSPPPQRALMPSASPDGSRVAYTLGTADGLQLAVQDLVTNAVRIVTPPGVDAVDARWSPDGRRLAYVRMLPQRSFIEILTLETGVTAALAIEGLAALREPSWSHDGRWLAVAGSPMAGEGEDWDLLLLQPDPPGAAFRLTSGAGNDRAPAWMPR